MNKGFSINNLINIKNRVRRAVERLDHSEEARAELQSLADEIERVAQEIELGENEWRAAFDAVMDPIFIHDHEYRVIRANMAYARKAGMDIREVIGKFYWEAFPRRDGPLAHCVKQLEKGGEPQNEIVALANGEIYLSRAYAIRDQRGGYVYSVHVMEDITEHQKALDALHDSEEIFRTISETAQDAILLLNAAGEIAYWNRSAERIFGYTADEALGRKAHQLLSPPQYRAAYENAWPQPGSSGTGPVIGKTFELSALRQDGTEFPIELSIASVRIRGQWHAVGILRDITSRKLAENELRETGDKLSRSLNLIKSVVESVPIRVFWKDRSSTFLGCNSLLAKDAGCAKPGELIGKTDFDLAWKEQAERYREDDLRVMERGMAELNYEEPQTTPRGDTAWLRTSKVPLFDEKHEVIGILGVYDDITEQKKTQQHLLRSEGRLKEAQAVAHLGSWELDLEKDELWWSDETYRIFGVEPDSTNTYASFLNAVHPDDREFVHAQYTASVENRATYDIEHRVLMPDGSLKWVNERCRTHYAADGTPLRSAGTTLDITERKRTEAQISRFGQIINSSLNEIYIFDARSLRFISANKGSLANLGYSLDQLLELTPLDLKPELTPDALNETLDALRRDESAVEVFETLHRRKDGSVYPVEVHLQYLAQEVPPVFVAIIQDITERRQAEERLRHSEAGLAEAQRIVHLGSWELNIADDGLSWSDEVFRILEIDPRSTDASYDKFIAAVHPDDRDKVERAYRQSVATGEPCTIVHRLLMRDGRIKHVREMFETHYGEDGAPVNSFGTIQDITDQHLTQQALSRSNRALKAIGSCNSALIHAVDEDELLHRMCQIIIDQGGYRFAWVGQIEHDREARVRPVACAGFEDGYLDRIDVSYADTALGQGPVGRALRSGKPWIVHNTLTDSNFAPWRDAAVKRGYRSVLSLPLKERGGEVFAALTIYAKETDAFDSESLALMQALSDDLSFGIASLRIRKQRDHYQQEHRRSDERYKQSLVDTIRAIALTVEKRDPYTSGHMNKVARLSVAIGRELGMDEARLEGLRLGGMIHDIGKIYVPAEILNRPGRLTKAELEIIRSHAEVGYDIIKDVQFPWPVADMVVQHHERLDGSGYPRGLHAEDIIPEARILAVADVVDAITSHRPYRPAHDVEDALREIEKNRGVLYDPAVVDACLKLIREKGFDLDAVDAR